MSEFVPDRFALDDNFSPPESSEFDRLDIWEATPLDEVLPPLEGDLFDYNEPRLIGNPEVLGDFYRYQGNTVDCALYAQGGILQANGRSFDVEAFRQQGQDEDWYDPTWGTDVPVVGRLIEEVGIPVKYYDYGASFTDLATELSQGHGIVAVVDTDPIWGEPGGHALWVTGMEVNSDGNPASVICNDSGRPDGRSIAYPADQFAQAWALQSNYMVATRSPLAALSG